MTAEPPYAFILGLNAKLIVYRLNPIRRPTGAVAVSIHATKTSALTTSPTTPFSLMCEKTR